MRVRRRLSASRRWGNNRVTPTWGIKERCMGGESRKKKLRFRHLTLKCIFGEGRAIGKKLDNEAIGRADAS